MLFISDSYTTPPEVYKNVLQKEIYRALNELKIPFERVDTGEAITMEDCIQINNKFEIEVVKTLFLCNRQQTEFYLFITKADKPFKTKDFSRALGIARVSFGTALLMEKMLGTEIGATTVFSALIDMNDKVHIVFDKDVVEQEWYGCADGTTTCYMKVKTSHILEDFLPYTKHVPSIIEV